MNSLIKNIRLEITLFIVYVLPYVLNSVRAGRVGKDSNYFY